MATLSSPGIGSGLDINGIVSKLMLVESRPLTQLAAKEASFQAKISAYGSVKSALDNLLGAVNTLKTAGTYTGLSATSSNKDVATATAASGALAGTYSINVTQLAKYHTVRSSDAYTATSNTFTHGTLSIQIGSGTPVNITIDGSNNTLAGIRDAINAANAGVKASIVNDGTNYRLILNSQTLGSSGAITVAVTDSGSGGSFALGNLASPSLVTTQNADDAQLTINGLAITRSSNTITDAIDNVTLNLVATGSTTVTVGKNTAAVVAAFDGFVKAFNEAKKQIDAVAKYDPQTKKAAVLTGDAAIRSVQSQLNQLVFSRVSGFGDIGTLSDIGIRLQSDGTLKLDTAKLTEALNDPNKDVKGLMTQTTAGNPGIAVRFATALQSMLEAKGVIDSRTEGINASIKLLQQQTETMKRRLQDIEARYRAQFSALDSTIASMSQTSQYLTQQLANLPKINTG
ncbi:MAG: flagellar filament capping protein FliD [Rhodocyclaceae bacterium]|nr:flagellar filament capping protein FliD [Rhodocyclaceae bacterium]